MSCYNSAIIPAPVEKVWDKLRKFHDLAWSPTITSVDRTGDPEQAGAQRKLNGAFEETLVELDDEHRVLRYSIDDGPGPVAKENVSGYVGIIQAFPVTDNGTTFVLWTSSWQSGGEGATEFCNPIYRAVLADLQAHFS